VGGFGNPPLQVFLHDTSLQLGDAFFELGDAAALLPILLPPAVPDPTLELHRGLENLSVLGLDPGTLLPDPTLYVLHAPPV
jgi:hypothetical protein